MSKSGQNRECLRRRGMSVLPPISLQKSFSGDERNFLELLMRFVCGDVRDLIVSHKTDHGPAHRRYRALQQWRRLKICFREIFGIVRFSTFATLSPRQQTSVRRPLRSVSCQQPTSTWVGNPSDPPYNSTEVGLRAMVQERPVRVERRLSAILAADVAGYSRLMHHDEEATHAKLTSLLAGGVEPAISEHGGRIVKNAGDGFLAEFPSAVEAVRAAMQFRNDDRTSACWFFRPCLIRIILD